jgi:hypothetical protein
MIDWMPVNPCTPDCKGRDSYCPPRNRFGCEAYKCYESEVYAKRKLLEYLIAEKECYLHSERIIYTADIRYMLKQLEASQ